jgi:hypothetical protein
MQVELPVLDRMQALVDQWKADSDQRFIFLSCYQMMTANMLAAIQGEEFADCAWVDHLLTRFAEYYFAALEAYEQQPATAPRAWQVAFEAARSPNSAALQKLLLGVNAHINYDLVLTLGELMEPEWQGQASADSLGRHTDFCHVNDIIAATIDAVQDEVLEPVSPVMELIDRLFGPIDELLISRLITDWRDEVWSNTNQLLAAQDAEQRRQVIQQVETHALRRAAAINLSDLSALGELI